MNIMDLCASRKVATQYLPTSSANYLPKTCTAVVPSSPKFLTTLMPTFSMASILALLVRHWTGPLQTPFTSQKLLIEYFHCGLSQFP